MLTEFWVGHQQRLLSLSLVDNFIRQELLQALADLALLQRGVILYCRGGRGEPMQRLQLQALRQKMREHAILM